MQDWATPLDPLPLAMQRLTQNTVGFQTKKKKKENLESWWILYSAWKTGVNQQNHPVWSSGGGGSWPGFSSYLSSFRGDSHYLTDQNTWHSSQGKTSCSSAGLQGRWLPRKAWCEELNRFSTPFLPRSLPHPWDAHQLIFPPCKHKSCCKGVRLGLLFLSFQDKSEFFNNWMKWDQTKERRKEPSGEMFLFLHLL